VADPNSCRTCKHRESGDDAYHCYMFKVEPEPLCMQHQDRKPKRVGTIGHVGGRTTLMTALTVIVAQQSKAGSDGVAGRDPQTFPPSTPDGADR
jgi:hypothetical protein